MSAKFEVYRDNSREFRFRMLDALGENLLASEGYKEKRSAFNGIASIKKNCLIAERFVRKKMVDGRGYFVLKARNHEVIAKARSYENEAGVDSGIATVMREAPDAEIVDLTKRRVNKK